jgi:hypothetical protein
VIVMGHGNVVSYLEVTDRIAITIEKSANDSRAGVGP